MTHPDDETPQPSSVIAVIVSWAIVGLPMAWGVSQTVIKSMALFR